VPAAAQSLVGIKPTFALVPNTGGLSLSGTGRDVVGPLARTVRDAAIMLDVMAGYSAADPKTTAAIGNIPDGGYASLLGTLTLRGARVGLYGPGFQDTSLSPETAALYEAAVAELRDLGAETVDDPFAGTAFSNLAWLDPAGIDSRPMETLPYDLDQYLHRLGPDALARSLPELRRLADPFAPDGPMGFLMPLVAATIDNPEVLPDLTAFAKAREDYIDAFNEVFLGQEIDVLVFPTLATGVPALGTNPNPLLNPFPVPITVSEVNLAGLPAVVVPGGRYPDGAPFSLVFVGPLWSEAKLLAYAYDYEQATHHRVTAELEAPAGQ
jgi:Asp-tRNA(Asn)/Glu-tRNA(Gln) amidotransferase A subunit family amidase